MAEKKIEVEINGRKMRIPEHMLADMQKFGASLTKRTIKDPPKELLNMTVPKKVILPEPPVIPQSFELPGEIVEPPKAILTDPVEPEKTKKKPVRRKK